MINLLNSLALLPMSSTARTYNHFFHNLPVYCKLNAPDSKTYLQSFVGKVHKYWFKSYNIALFHDDSTSSFANSSNFEPQKLQQVILSPSGWS